MKTTPAQDKKIAENFNQMLKDYNIYFNNCTDAVQDGVQNGTNVGLPLDIFPGPNGYFSKLEKMLSNASSTSGSSASPVTNQTPAEAPKTTVTAPAPGGNSSSNGYTTCQTSLSPSSGGGTTNGTAPSPGSPSSSPSPGQGPVL